jgi:hypothetical protein
MSSDGVSQMTRMSPRLAKLSLIGLAATMFAVAIASIALPLKRQMQWVDAVSGSTKEQCIWRFGYNDPAVIQRTELADWIEAQEGTHTFDWRHVNGTWKTLWGTPRDFGHGPAPAIYSLQGPMMDSFVNRSSNDELREFVEIMRSGTKSEQYDAVFAAIDKVGEQD